VEHQSGDLPDDCGVIAQSKHLKPAFFKRDARLVARDLLGCSLSDRTVTLRITETEAYIPGDSANHAWKGLTPRNKPMWGSCGTIYVYLCYGLHHLLNLVCDEVGRPAAVLIRACDIISGHDCVAQRRGGRLDLKGPGKVGQSLNIDTSLSGEHLGHRLQVHSGPRPNQILQAPRIGIDYALPADRDALMRYIGCWSPSSS